MFQRIKMHIYHKFKYADFSLLLVIIVYFFSHNFLDQIISISSCANIDDHCMNCSVSYSCHIGDDSPFEDSCMGGCSTCYGGCWGIVVVSSSILGFGCIAVVVHSVNFFNSCHQCQCQRWCYQVLRYFRTNVGSLVSTWNNIVRSTMSHCLPDVHYPFVYTK